MWHFNISPHKHQHFLGSGLKEQMKLLQEKMHELETKNTEAVAGAAGASADTTMPKHWTMDAQMQAGGFQLVTVRYVLCLLSVLNWPIYLLDTLYLPCLLAKTP